MSCNNDSARLTSCAIWKDDREISIGGLGTRGLVCRTRIFGVSLDVLLAVLRTLEPLVADVAAVGLQGHMDAHMRGDVVPLDGGGVAATPLTSQLKIVRALAPDVRFAHMILPRKSSSATSSLR